jgi:glucose-6-phosphate-specific signal transduction histidine kinase
MLTRPANLSQSMGSLRACVHDLRNLFAVVASAKSLLERPLDDNKRRLVLDVLGRFALEGKVVSDAAAAGAHRIAIRAARRSYRYWLMVADDGPGFASRSPAAPAGLHGTGMRRLAAAVEAAHGKIRIRSKKGRGSAVGLIFPIMRIVTSSGEFPADRSRRAG